MMLAKLPVGAVDVTSVIGVLDLSCMVKVELCSE